MFGEMMPDCDELRLISELLFHQHWVFAKTMPKHPHWYTLRKNWNNDSDFDKVVDFIRQNGRIEYFLGKPYTVLDIEDMKYWTMGAAVIDTILINKAKISP
jgi:hypothetical protein